jgi:4-alpha-glucanotransferase
MANESLIRQLAELRGIGADFHNYLGEHCQVSLGTQQLLLTAMDDDLTSDESTTQAINQARDQRGQQLLPPVVVFNQGQPYRVEICLTKQQKQQSLAWQLTTEQGEEQPQQQVTEESRHYQPLKLKGGQSRWLLSIQLPEHVPLGYHQLTLSCGVESQQCVVIIAPQQAYQPPVLTEGKKIWGANVQLYGLRSKHNWGIGDFSDLQQLSHYLAQQGADIIGINPLHSLYPNDPQQVSPYSASHRHYLNALYIDITQVAEYADQPELQAKVKSADCQSCLAKLRDVEQIDYPSVSQLKLEALELLFSHFQHHHLQVGSARGQAFQQFVKADPELQLYALYDALAEHFSRQDDSNYSWQHWPAEYRQPDSQAVVEFKQQHQTRIQFYLYIQWLAELQLAEAAASAREAGMRIGLYRDLALGANASGAEVWANQSLYCLTASVGAPPDPLALQGQNWGFPPMHPQRMREQSYRSFIRLLQQNMRHCGALRIDHVMGLMRLWWCPQGEEADTGAYVYYPMDELLAIVRLESVRNQCLVIGEDLGTVPEALRHALAESAIYSTLIVYFEKVAPFTFKAKEHYRPQAQASISNHDLATIAAYWEQYDLDLRDQLQRLPPAVLTQEYRNRVADKAALLQALSDAWLLPEGTSLNPDKTPCWTEELNIALHRFLGYSQANIAIIQLEDLLMMKQPVNVPGTFHEYPNWQRKLSHSLEQIIDDPKIKHLLGQLRQARETISNGG